MKFFFGFLLIFTCVIFRVEAQTPRERVELYVIEAARLVDMKDYATACEFYKTSVSMAKTEGFESKTILTLEGTSKKICDAAEYEVQRNRTCVNYSKAAHYCSRAGDFGVCISIQMGGADYRRLNSLCK